MNSSHDRDQSVERLLRQSLKAPQPAMDSCLDAETLAAWLDGSLFGSALEVAQSHVADCSRCSAIVGGVVRAEAAVPAVAPVRRRWLTWFVPVTAAAAAVVLWVVVPRNTGPAPSTPGSLEQAKDATLREQETVDLTRPAVPAQEPQSKDSASRSEIDSFQKQRSDLPDSGSAARSDEQRAAATAPSAPAAAPEAFRAGTANTLAAASAAEVQVPSPDPAVLWRIIGAAVQRSTDGGVRWNVVSTGTSSELRAGAAPSAAVCWMVGRGGVILLSMDGGPFLRVPFPEMTDLSAITATDGRSASVTTIDGRTFATADAGTTWVPR